MNTRSLRFQLLAWYSSLLLVAFAAVWLLIFVAARQSLVQNLRDLLSRRARQIAHLAGQYSEPAELEREIRQLYAPDSPEAQGRFARVSSPDGTLFVSGPPANGLFNPADIPKPSDNEIRSGFARHKPLQMIFAYATVGDLLVEVGGSTAPIKEDVSRMLLPLLLAAPVLLLLASGGAYLLIGRALQPVVRIARSAEEITLHKTDAALPVVQTGDEIEALALSLNRMIQRIQDAVENNRRFVADASHELKTPLAVMRGELEMLLRNDSLSPAARETLASNLEEVERLSRIVQGLTALSRLDAGEANAESVVFDLSRLAVTTADQMSLLAEDKGVKIRSDAKPVSIAGDPARIKQVIVNLLDNAIKHSPAGGAIDLRVADEGGHALLQISDEGSGIPAEALPKIFERFYRVDKARSRDEGGAGLGLAIAKSICQAHGAEISAESPRRGGAVFKVRFSPARLTPD